MFFSRFGQILILLLINSKSQAVFPFFFQFFTPFHYAAPACLYLYVTKLLSGHKTLDKLDWLHFIPLVIAIIHVIPWPWSPIPNWDAVAKQISVNGQLFINVSGKIGLFEDYFYYIGRSSLIVGYLIATWIAVLTYKTASKQSLNIQVEKWIFFFLKAATFFQLISFCALIPGNLYRPFISSLIVTFSCMSLLVMMVFVLHNPRFFYGYLFVAVGWSKDDTSTKEILTIAKPEPLSLPTVKRINLLPDQLSAYKESINAFMEAKKPYLRHDFQIVDLASEINVPVHHCSFMINNLIGKNFRDWINGYRVNYFLDQYPLKSQKMTIEAIAYEAGFKSLTTFYNAFKKETTLMPKAYFLQKKMC